MTSIPTSARPTSPARLTRFRWWHAVGIFALANAASAAPAGYGGDDAFYNSFRQPSVAPPDWLFAPMWVLLNLTSLYALYRVAHRPAATGVHKTFYISEGVFWITFATFTTLYFGMKSPMLGALNTLVGLAATAVSTRQAAKVDPIATTCLAPRLAWLALAGFVSVYVALHNRDELIGAGPLAVGN